MKLKIKNSQFGLAAGSAHTFPNGLRKRWADSRLAARGGGSPQRAKPVKINAHYLAPPFRDPAAPEGLHK